MNALDQLTIQAFQIALDRVGALPDGLQHQIDAITPDLTSHIHQLEDLAEQYEPLHEHYQQAREDLQSQSAERKQFLANGISGQENVQQNSPQVFDVDAKYQVPPSDEVKTPNDHTSSRQPTIYRHTLQREATPQQRDLFQQQVEAIKQANPDWVVIADRPQPGEADAIILIHKDEDYASIHAAYVANRTLDDVVAPALTQIFTPRP